MRLEAEEKARAAGVQPGAYWMVSRDSGETWTEIPYNCTPYAMPCPDGSVKSLCMEKIETPLMIACRLNMHKVIVWLIHLKN